MEAPIEVIVKVWVKDEDGMVGQATVDLPVGVYPTKQDIDDAIAKTREFAEETDFEVIDSHREFAEEVIFAKYGQKVAVDVGDEWDEPFSERKELNEEKDNGD